MNVLLDTHTLLWFIDGSPKLGANALPFRLSMSGILSTNPLPLSPKAPKAGPLCYNPTNI